MEYFRQGPPGYLIDSKGYFVPEDLPYYPPVAFGSGFTPAELAKSGTVTSIIALVLGAGISGALVMGLGSMIVEAGSTKIAPGWKRYILGLFRKPHP